MLLVGVFLLCAAFGGFAADKVKITVWCFAFDPHVNGFTNVIEAFNSKNPDIEVGLEPQPGQAELVSKMRAALAAGSGTAQAFNTPGPPSTNGPWPTTSCRSPRTSSP